MRFWASPFLLLLAGLCVFATPATAQTTSWQTEIYDNIWLTGQPIVRRNDGAIAFAWGEGSPSGGVEPDFFSVRWTATITLNDHSRLRFNVRADDGIRVFVDGQTVLYAWEGQAKAGAAADKWLTAGSHTVVVEYYEHSGNAYAFFDYETVETDADRPDLIPTVTPSVPLPTSTPVPFSTHTPRPFATSIPAPFPTHTPPPPATPVPTWTRIPPVTDTPRPTATVEPLPTDTPRPTLTSTSTPTTQPIPPTVTSVPKPTMSSAINVAQRGSQCDLTPQPICIFYWSKIYGVILPQR